MSKLKEYWPFLALTVLLVWAVSPYVNLGISNTQKEAPGAVLHRQTAEHRANNTIYSAMLERSKQA